MFIINVGLNVLYYVVLKLLRLSINKENLIEANGAKEYISLFPPERDIFTKIADAELFVPSSDYVSFPNVLLEAMAQANSKAIG